MQKLLFREPPFILAGDTAESTLLRERNVCPTEDETEKLWFFSLWISPWKVFPHLRSEAILLGVC